MSLLRRTITKASLGRALGLRSLRQRLSLVPVAVVLAVSLVAAFFVHQKARSELYESREQLARGLADNVAQHLTDQLSEVWDELASWATFLAGPTARQLQGATEQDRFQIWLQGLGDLARSRYDIIALVDGDRRIAAINEMALSVPLARPLGAESFVGRDVAALLGEADDQWIRRTLENRLPSTLSWRAIATVNELYARKEITRPDDVVRSHQLVFAVPVRQPDGVSTRALIAVVVLGPLSAHPRRSRGVPRRHRVAERLRLRVRQRRRSRHRSQVQGSASPVR